MSKPKGNIPFTIGLILAITGYSISNLNSPSSSSSTRNRRSVSYYEIEDQSPGAVNANISSQTANSPPASPNTPDPPSSEPTGQGVNATWRGYQDIAPETLARMLPAQAQHLAPHFIASARTHQINPLFLVAISQHETGNWTSNAFRNRNNAMGISNARGVISQASHAASIEAAARSLAGAPGTAGHYRNAHTIAQVGAIYAPIGAANDPRNLNTHWARSVAANYHNYQSQLQP